MIQDGLPPVVIVVFVQIIDEQYQLLLVAELHKERLQFIVILSRQEVVEQHQVG